MQARPKNMLEFALAVASPLTSLVDLKGKLERSYVQKLSAYNHSNRFLLLLLPINRGNALLMVLIVVKI